MTQDGADRLMMALGSAVGFAAGGTLGLLASGLFKARSTREDWAPILGVAGAATGSAIGAISLFPKAVDRCGPPPQPARFP